MFITFGYNTLILKSAIYFSQYVVPLLKKKYIFFKRNYKNIIHTVCFRI